MQQVQKRFEYYQEDEIASTAPSRKVPLNRAFATLFALQYFPAS